MEQLLNLVWLFAVACLVIAVAARPNRGPNARPRYAALVVFACIALLLFPVISASDDLHAALDFSDEAAWRHDKRCLGVQLLAFLVIVSLAPLLVRHICSLRSLTQIGSAHSGYLRLEVGRAPPLAF